MASGDIRGAGNITWKRIGHVEFEIEGQNIRYDNLDFRFDITKITGGAVVGGSAKISVLGLSRNMVQTLATYLSAAANLQEKHSIKVYAGYEHTGEQLIFAGDIQTAVPNQPVENWLDIEANVLGWRRAEIVSVQTNDTITIRKLAEKLAEKSGLALVIMTNNTKALEKKIDGFDCVGNYFDIIKKLNTISQLPFSISPSQKGLNGKEGLLIVGDEDMTKLTGNKKYIISKDTGMIGIPKISFPCIQVRTLMNPYINPWDMVEVKSVMYPYNETEYVIRQIRYNGQLRGTPWYMDLFGYLPQGDKSRQNLSGRKASWLRSEILN